jgi:hypothetical protein
MFWFTGMHNPKLQLLVHGDNIANTTVTLTYPGVKLIKVNKVKNPNYLFLDLTIAATVKSGSFPINFSVKGKKIFSYTYELKTAIKVWAGFRASPTKILFTC